MMLSRKLMGSQPVNSGLLHVSAALCTAVAILCGSAALQSQQAEPSQAVSQRPAILITNDDGIRSPGMRLLAEELGSFADVVIAAPSGNRSGSSQSLGLRETVSVERLEEGVYSIDSTPAGCVAVAMDLLAPEGGFDLVISGPNTVENVGADADISGTVGAARMATRYGVPAIAASHSMRCRDRQAVVVFLRQLAGEALERKLPPSVLLNVNLPAGQSTQWKAPLVTRLGGSGFTFRFQGAFDEQGKMETKAQVEGFKDASPEGSDSWALAQGHVSISVLPVHTAVDPPKIDLKDWKSIQAPHYVRQQPLVPELPPVSLQDWRSERIALPPEFAPQLPSGDEILLFAPGMFVAEAPDYWSYAFLMRIDQDVPDATELTTLFERYFDGLLGAVGGEEIGSDPAQVSLRQIGPGRYEGEVRLIDAFVTQQPVDLRLLVRSSTENGATSLRVQASPQPREHAIWQSLAYVAHTLEI